MEARASMVSTTIRAHARTASMECFANAFSSTTESLTVTLHQASEPPQRQKRIQQQLLQAAAATRQPRRMQDKMDLNQQLM